MQKKKGKKERDGVSHPKKIVVSTVPTRIWRRHPPGINAEKEGKKERDGVSRPKKIVISTVHSYLATASTGEERRGGRREREREGEGEKASEARERQRQGQEWQNQGEEVRGKINTK